MRTLEQRLKDLYKEARSALAGATNHPGFAINTQAVRELADTLDGIVFATNMLRQDHLIDSTDDHDLRDALRALRHAYEAASCSNTNGFAEGVHRAQVAVVTMLEGKQ